MPATPRTAVEQLDLFAEAEAAAAQCTFDQAPRIYDTLARGYFHRITAIADWTAQYGNFDSKLRSHAWRPANGSPDNPDAAANRCQPVVLTADLRCHHHREDCSCVGDLLYRGACLHFEWEGHVRVGENDVAEDAHDHAWPGWRELSIVRRQPENNKARSHWVEQVNDAYPDGWLESGEPIRTARQRYGTRHVPNHTAFGGYDLCGVIAQERAS